MDDEDGYLFDGGVTGQMEEAVGVVRRMSEALEIAGIEHELHIVDGPSFPESRFAEESET
jgi:hypothetical protein